MSPSPEKKLPPGACRPNYTPRCDLGGCRCELIQEPPPPACKPPFVEHCVLGTCGCVPPSVAFPPPGVDGAEGCSIVLTLIVAGVKKTLLACWVDG